MGKFIKDNQLPIEEEDKPKRPPKQKKLKKFKDPDQK